MKVVFDSQIFSSQQYGGVSRYISNLASYLTKEGVDAKIIAPFHINSHLAQLPDSIVSGVKIERPPVLGHFLRASNQFLGLFSARKINPDIIHETFYSRYINWSKKAVHIITVYDMIHELYPGKFSGKRQINDEKKIAIRRADRVICISNSTKHDLLKLYDLPENKVSVIHLGFDKLDLDVALDGEECSPMKQDYLLYVGDRSGYKNFGNFLRAFADSVWLRRNFFIVCFGGGCFKKSEHEILCELKLPEGSVLQVSGDDRLLAKYYRHAALFVYPSLYEGFGIPPLEAMSNSCPVVCSNTSSIPEVAGNAAAFFSPDSIDSIRDVIESILNSPDEISTMRDKGLIRVENFKWEKCAKETHHVYKQSLGISR